MREIEACRDLLQQADDLRLENPGKAAQVAKTALACAARIDREEAGTPQWHLLQVEVWAVRGSVLRSLSNLCGAEDALNVALAFLCAPELRAYERLPIYAQLAQRAAYLRRDQGRYEDALYLVDEAIGVYQREGAGQSVASAWADRGLILGRAGCQQEAIVHLSKALDRLDPNRSPKNFLAAVYNTAHYLHDLADHSPEANRLALKWLEVACHCHRFLPPESVRLLKIRTLGGLTAIRLERIEEGVHELWQTQEGFQRLGAAFEQSQTLLYIAGAYLAAGRRAEMRQVAGWLFPALRSLRGDREASAALRCFYNAARGATATQELIDRVSATLRKAQVRSLESRSKEPA